MRHLRSWASLLLFLFSTTLGDAILAQDHATELDAAARSAYASGDFARAAELAIEVYRIRLQSLGPDDLQVATAALNVGDSLLRTGAAADAVGFLTIACAGGARHFGESHPNVGSCLLDLAAAHAGAKQIDEANRVAERALSIIEATHPDEQYGAALFRAGEIFRAAGASTVALHYFKHSGRVFEALGADGRIYLASINSEIGQILHALSRFGEAAAALELTLNSQRAQLGAQNAATISTAYFLADCYQKTGEYERALRLLEEIAAALAELQEQGHMRSADVLLEIADLQRRSGGIIPALDTCQRVLKELALDPSDSARLQKVRALTLSGEIYADQHLFGEAERLLQEAVHQGKGSDGDQESLQMALERQGFYLIRRGRFAEGRARLEEALEVVEQAKGPHSLDVAALLERIVVPLVSANDCERALPIIARAKAIYKGQQPQSQELVRVLKLAAACANDETSRARAMAEALELQAAVQSEVSAEFLLDTAREHLRKRELAEAERLTKEALRLDATRADAHDVLSDVFGAQGKDEDAVRELRTAIEVATRSYGADSMSVAGRQFNLGGLLLRAEDAESARKAYLTAAEGFANHTSQLFGSLSLAEQRRLLPQQAAAQISGVLSMCQDDACLDEGYSLLLPWKGLIVSGLARQAAIARAVDSNLDSSVSSRWKAVRSQLAEWTLVRGAQPYERWRQRHDELAREKEALERQLLGDESSAGEPPRLAIGDLRSSLREGEVFVDIYKFADFLSKPRAVPAYSAILVGKRFGPKFVRLGTSTDLELAVSAWRNGIGQLSDRPWVRLQGAIWEPIAQALPAGTRTIRVSPDGDLTKVPWHLFAFPIDSAASMITEVDSARSLVRVRRRHGQRQRKERVLVIGGVDYDAGRKTTSPGHPGSPFPDLQWAREEAEAVVSLAQAKGLEVVWLQNDTAAKGPVLKRSADATYILFATHAFSNTYGERGLWDRGYEVGESYPWGRNPLVETGLALSGANVRDETSFVTKGVLTAEEVLDADLSAATLIVLSACSSGLGAEAEGQGMLGLRSAFLAAGARTLVVSLWNVDDRATQILMRAFFRELWSDSTTVAEALRKAQEEVRRHGSFRAPKYWAGWAVVDPG